jgi:acylphosphatase
MWRDDLDETRRSLLNLEIWDMKKEAPQARRFFVSGRVQGVGYRFFAQRAAGELRLSGYVRNRHDGRVEVFAMGSAQNLRLLGKELEKGPMMAHVTEINEEPATVDTRYSDNFTVEYTL